MISVWASWMPIILIFLIIDKKSNVKQKLIVIFRLFTAFVAGIAVVLIPFAGWYIYHGAFNAMINTYLGYNSQYMGENPTSMSSIGSVIRTFSHMEILTTFIFSIYIVAVVQWSYKNLKNRRILICWGNILYCGITVYLISIVEEIILIT